MHTSVPILANPNARNATHRIARQDLLSQAGKQV
jgi:hypothetical protein